MPCIFVSIKIHQLILSLCRSQPLSLYDNDLYLGNGVSNDINREEILAEINPKMDLMKATIWSQHLEIDKLQKELWEIKGLLNVMQ